LSLESLGLARNSSSGESCRRWARTERGTQTLEEGGVREERRARRVFHFTVATPDADAARVLPLEAPPLTPPREPWPFLLALLTESFERRAEWKKRWGFPADATTLASLSDAGEPWEGVVVAAHGWLSLLCVRSVNEQGVETLQGFPVQPEGWTLKLHQPV